MSFKPNDKTFAEGLDRIKNVCDQLGLKCIVFFVASACGLSGAWAQEDESKTADGEGTQLSMVKIDYSCEQASSIKFNQITYESLPVWEQTLIDTKYRMCKTPADAEEAYVLVVSPAATSENSKIFYGTVKRADLEKARGVCKTAGQVGGVGLNVASMVGAAVPIAGDIGTAIYNYSDVSCNAIADNAVGGNMMLLLGPTSIVAHATASKLAKDTINLIPLVSTADKKNIADLVDKVTAPPSISVGRVNVNIQAGPVKLSVPKPKPKIKIKIKL